MTTEHDYVGKFSYEQLAGLSAHLREAIDGAEYADYMVSALYPDNSRELTYREVADVAHLLRTVTATARAAESALLTLVPQARSSNHD